MYIEQRTAQQICGHETLSGKGQCGDGGGSSRAEGGIIPRGQMERHVYCPSETDIPRID